MPKIIHYREKCIGCGICQELQPGLWRMSRKDGKAILVNSVPKKQVFLLPVSKHMEDSLVQVIEACPVKIIRMEVQSQK